jgi:hypothetical protein
MESVITIDRNAQSAQNVDGAAVPVSFSKKKRAALRGPHSTSQNNYLDFEQKKFRQPPRLWQLRL